MTVWVTWTLTLVPRSAELVNFANATSADWTEPLGAAICRSVAMRDR